MSPSRLANPYLVLLLCLSFLYLPVLAQKSKTSPEFFYYNEKGEPVKENGAAFMVVVTPNLTTGTWKVDTYNYAGPLFRSEEFKDYEQTIAEGRFIYYSLHNIVDSAGTYRNSLRHGDWYFFNEKGSLKFVKTYENGILVKTQQPDKDYSTLTILGEQQSTDIQDSYFAPGEKVWVNFLQKEFTIRHVPENLKLPAM
jgi:antitoxin component YwqK of YwqJK toxin-antitoxin module